MTLQHMSKEGQIRTKAVYEDPELVAGYIKSQSKNPPLQESVELFARTLPGTRVIDIGCGPGHDTHHFAKLGYQATGIDYSSEMIKAAKSVKITDNPPAFFQLDMKQLGRVFPANSYDGAWASASLLHIPETDTPTVLKGIHRIVRDAGQVYIGLKEGKQGEYMVAEDKYGKPMEREFTLWEKDKFQKLTEKSGFKTVRAETEKKGQTSWLNFYLQVKK